MNTDYPHDIKSAEELAAMSEELRKLYTRLSAEEFQVVEKMSPDKRAAWLMARDGIRKVLDAPGAETLEDRIAARTRALNMTHGGTPKERKPQSQPRNLPPRTSGGRR